MAWSEYLINKGILDSFPSMVEPAQLGAVLIYVGDEITSYQLKDYNHHWTIVHVVKVL